MQQVLIFSVISDLFGVSVFAACASFTRFQVLLKTKTTILVIPRARGWYQESAHFAGVIEAINCTHIRIICPNRENAMAFINRKHFYSINVQVVRIAMSLLLIS